MHLIAQNNYITITEENGKYHIQYNGEDVICASPVEVIQTLAKYLEASETAWEEQEAELEETRQELDDCQQENIRLREAVEILQGDVKDLKEQLFTYKFYGRGDGR